MGHLLERLGTHAAPHPYQQAPNARLMLALIGHRISPQAVCVYRAYLVLDLSACLQADEPAAAADISVGRRGPGRTFPAAHCPAGPPHAQGGPRSAQPVHSFGGHGAGWTQGFPGKGIPGCAERAAGTREEF